jgi:hypothetical protein
MNTLSDSYPFNGYTINVTQKGSNVTLRATFTNPRPGANAQIYYNRDAQEITMMVLRTRDGKLDLTGANVRANEIMLNVRNILSSADLNVTALRGIWSPEPPYNINYEDYIDQLTEYGRLGLITSSPDNKALAALLGTSTGHFARTVFNMNAAEVEELAGSVYVRFFIRSRN